MTKIDLPFVDVQWGRDGRVRYWYFRRDGRRWRLPGEPGSEEFLATYHRLLAETNSKPAPADVPGTRSYPHGSIGRVILEYLASARFNQKKPRTQAEHAYAVSSGKLDRARFPGSAFSS